MMKSQSANRSVVQFTYDVPAVNGRLLMTQRFFTGCSFLRNKTKFLIALSVVFSITAVAQVPKQIMNLTGVKYVYAGSLVMESASTLNSQKLVIKIFGGSWFSDSNGETSYYISNRDGLSVRMVSQGALLGGVLALKLYQNGSSTDFYILPDPVNYSSFAITTYSYGFSLTPQFVNITEQAALPAGTDITASISIRPILVTDGNGGIGIGTGSPLEALSVKGKSGLKKCA